MDRILRMIVRRLAGRALNRGIDQMAGGGKAREDMTPDERRQARQARQNARRARQAARLMRRLK